MAQISTIVPVYKVEPYLHSCVDSIMAQTYTDFDLILVDDGSPDSSGSICDEYSVRDERIVVIHKKNGGLSDARNKGIELSLISDSIWTIFVDSDDWIDSHMFKVMMDQINKHGVKVCVCEAEKTDGKHYCANPCETIEIKRMKGLEYFTGGYSECASVACAKLIKESLLKNIRFPIGRLSEDDFFTYKLLYYADEIIYCSNKMYYYYINENSITHVFSKKRIIDMIDAVEERCLFFLQEEGPEHILANQGIIAEKCKLELKKLRTGQDDTKKAIVKKLRKVIVRNISKPEWKINRATSYYEIAFPFITNMYRKMRNLKEITSIKFRRRK